MSKHGLSSDLRALLNAARACLAHEIADQLGHVPAGRVQGGPDQRYISLAQYGTAGFPMADAILPLIYMSRNTASLANEGETDGGREGISIFDQNIDDQMAFLQDELINLAPPFRPRSQIPSGRSPVNAIYARVLREARFASMGQSAARVAAEAIVFSTDENGVRSPSLALTQYDRYAARMDALDAGRAEAEAVADAVAVARIDRDRNRLLAEWQTLGRKSEIEAALALIGDGEAQVLDRRRADLQDQLSARLRPRLAAAGPFAMSTLAPLHPLLDPVSHATQWLSGQIDRDAMGRILADRAWISAMGFDIDRSLVQRLQSLRFSFFTARVDRDWLNRDFLTGRFWDWSETLSDAKGTGLLPVIATELVFVRDVRLIFDASWTVRPREESTPARDVIPVAPIPVGQVQVLRRLDASEVTGALSPGFLSTVQGTSTLQSITRREVKANRVLLDPRLSTLIEGSGTAQVRQLVRSRSGVRRTNKPKTSGTATRQPRVSRPGGMLSVLAPNATRKELFISNEQVRGRLESALKTIPQTSRKDKAKGASRKIRFSFKIESLEAPGELDGLFLITRYLYGAGHVSDPTSLALTRTHTDRLEHELTRTAFMARRLVRLGSVSGIPATLWETCTIVGVDTRLVNSRRQELIRTVDTFPTSDGTVDARKDWVFRWTENELELAGSEVPILFSYGLELTPAAPQPDPTLDWSGPFVS